MKQLRITLLTVSILAISAFGINECAILIHKANASGLWRNIQISWNRSIYQTGNQLNNLNQGRPMNLSLQEQTNQIARQAIAEWDAKHPKPDHSKSIVDWSISNPPMAR